MRKAVFSLGLIMVVIISVFIIIRLPMTQREVLDGQRANDLNHIQWQIINYWQGKGQLPTKLSDLENSISDFKVPLDPESGKEYGYNITGPLNFELCAEFKDSSPEKLAGVPETNVQSTFFSEVELANSNWSHSADRACFPRIIDPELYQPNDNGKVRPQ